MTKPATASYDLPATMPLAIDVDGTLLRSDITQEMFWLGLMKFPWLALKILGLVKNDRPALKALLMPRLADVWEPEHLPYNPLVMSIARQHHDAGGDVILCSGSEAGLIERIADHLDCVDAGFGTSPTLNLVKGNKAVFLKDRYPDGFCYIGNSTQDFTVWPDADLALAIAPPKGVDAITDNRGQAVHILEPREPEWGALFETLRPSRWPYLFMVLMGVGFFWPLDVDASAKVFAMGLLSMILAYGAVCTLWDVRRVKSHRRDPKKRYRPLASGRLGSSTAILSAVIMMAISLALFHFIPGPTQAIVSTSFAVFMAGYGVMRAIKRVFR